MTHDAVVFDMDGVVVERTPSWVFDDAAEEALAAFGIDDLTDEEYQAVRGYAADPETAAERFTERRGVAFETVWATREAFVSAKQLTAVRRGEKTVYDDATTVARLPVDVAVVSNNQHGTVGKLLEYFDIASHVETWYGLRPTMTDMARRKPDTTYLERTLSELGAENAVFVGDRESDIEVASRAGIDVAFVRRPFNEDTDLDLTPTYDIGSLDALLEHTTVSGTDGRVGGGSDDRTGDTT